MKDKEETEAKKARERSSSLMIQPTEENELWKPEVARNPVTHPEMLLQEPDKCIEYYKMKAM